MKSKKYLLAFMAMGLVMVSCSDRESTVGDESSKYITVSTSIGNMARVTTDGNGTQSFTDGDEISVYAWTGEADKVPASDKLVVSNSINKLAGSAWTATPQMLWKNPTDKHYFIGIYPKTETPVADLASGAYSFDVDKQTESDLLVAVNTTGLTSASNPVPLVFDHVMAKLNVNLTYRNQWGGTPTVAEVKVVNAATKASVDYLTKTVAASDNGRAEVKLPELEPNTAYSSILIPQTGISTVQIKIGNEYFTYTHTGDIKLESGKYTTLNLIVGRDEITLGSVSISNWQEGAKLDGEALN